MLKLMATAPTCNPDGSWVIQAELIDDIQPDKILVRFSYKTENLDDANLDKAKAAIETKYQEWKNKQVEVTVVQKLQEKLDKISLTVVKK